MASGRGGGGRSGVIGRASKRASVLDVCGAGERAFGSGDQASLLVVSIIQVSTLLEHFRQNYYKYVERDPHSRIELEASSL
mmetsp:Transcript_449/g.1354  ORF Transcript_449/g.1354 Transcript_449/m.1354 type:complete len:81 (+) Transcript_449:146-388(+)